MPLILFIERPRITNWDIVQLIFKAIGHVNAFPDRSILLNLWRFAKWFWVNTPSKLLFSRYKLAKLESCPILLGIAPLNETFPKYKDCKLFLIQQEKMPLNSWKFWLMFTPSSDNNCNLQRLQRVIGIGPSRWEFKSR